jgi:hypothetical protein
MNEIIPIVASLSGLFIAGANAAFWAITKFNDMSHIQKSLDRIEKLQIESDKKLDLNAERIAKIEGKCLANHGN